MIGRRKGKGPSKRDLVALADGSLSAGRRARTERAVAASPELAAQVSDQRRALRAIRTLGSEPVPGPLRARLELASAPRFPAARRLHRLVAGAVGGAVAAVALAAAAVLALGGTTSGTPSVAAAATLGTRVAVSSTGATVPGVTAAGIAFPDWSHKFGLNAAGARRDTVDGRLATTVFYVGSGGRIAYTIVSGSPIRAGTATSAAVWNGVQLHSFSTSARAVVTWVRDGHTCIVSGRRSLLGTLMGLASWNEESGTSTGNSAAYAR
jgi:hypothetical protein